MHRCLDIEEIILIIFSLATRRDLAALAATCKTFRNPALETLWSELDDFAPLARCLPADMWNEAKDSYVLLPPISAERPRPVLTKLTLAKRPDETSDWSKFKFYASFVKDLHFEWTRQDYSSPTCLVDSDILHALMESELEKPVLPNLKVLRWSSPGVRLDRYIELFSGTQLAFLFIHYDGYIEVLDLPWAHDLGSLRHSAPNLTSIFITWPTRRAPQALASTVSNVICGLKHIVAVQLFGIQLTPEAIRHLATSSCTFLRVENDVIEILDSIRGFAPTPPFPELRILVVSFDDIASLTRLIEVLRAETLQSINAYHRIRDQDVATETEMEMEAKMGTGVEELIRTLEARCSHTELTYLSFSNASDSTPPLPRYVLAPLLKFKHMRHLNIHRLGFDLDDDDIKAIAAAWPCLEYIGLCSALHWRDVQSKVTLASIVTLAQHCPELRRFDLVIYIAVVDFTLLPPGGVVTPNRNVDRISIGNSSLGDLVDPAELATFLSSLFPTLNAVFGSQTGDSWRNGVWNIITGFLPANNDTRSSHLIR